ncbi:MAG: LysM peptidoglycan-binding domain-containing protein [Clostridia bacterium]|nr:LysM peptidoglycan-binding domain-containing protein [Clostridia bacterium]
MTIHTVKPGESVYSIARQYKVPMERIISDNELTDPGRLAVGQTLVIRYPKEYHIVEPGETLVSIAMRHDMTVNEIFQLNPSLGGQAKIEPGQTLILSLTQPKQGTIATNGYLYPNIDRLTLRKALPFLTYASVFSYDFTPEGDLLQQEDGAVVTIIRSYGTKPMLVLTTLGADGLFSSERASVLLRNEAAQDRLLAQLAETMARKGYAGLDIDFEYIPPEDADAYAAFVKKAEETLGAKGYEVFVALAPKTSRTQKGLLYEAHDYAALGNAADNALLMTYEWGYSRSAPMAVAPINKVRQVVDFALTEIPASKLFLGMPNYGYDWTLPYVQGVSVARSIGNVEAVQQAVEQNAAIEYDWTAQSPHYNYYHSRIGHEVWFEDARSVAAKLALASEKKLRGVSIWSLMKWFPQLWLLIGSLYNIEKR